MGSSASVAFVDAVLLPSILAFGGFLIGGPIGFMLGAIIGLLLGAKAPPENSN